MSDRAVPGTFRSTAWWQLSSPWQALLGSLTIAAVTCLAYLPAMNGEFLWDDTWLVLNNKVIQAPDGLYRIWFTTDPKYYWPVTNSVFWIEWRLLGTNPVGYHLVNVVLHISAALLIWLLLKRLGIPGGFLAALLWAVHPVSVEGVAWISQLKTVLSTVFMLLSMLAYLKSDSQMTAEARASRWCVGRWYWLSLLAFLLGMLSKASITPLPLLLLLIVWWLHGTVTRWDLLRAAPFFLVAGALVPVNMWFERHAWSGETFRAAGFLERLASAAAIPWFYLGKALVPANLVFIYPEWSIDVKNVLWWLPLLASTTVTAVLVWQRNTRWGRALLFAWAFFWLGLIPVLGFTDVSLMKFTLVSDHYQYISLIAVTAVVAVGAVMLWNRLSNPARWAVPLTAAAAVGALMLVSRQESATYRDELTLLETTLARNPACWVAHCGLGVKLKNSQQTEEALAHFRAAAEYNPEYAVAHYHIGMLLVTTGRIEEGVAELERCVELDPALAGAHGNLGAALARLGRLPEALVQFQKAVEANPDLSDSHRNLGTALYETGNPDGAITEFQTAIRLEPIKADSYSDLGAVLLNVGKAAEAVEPLEQATRLNPNHPLARLNLGSALAILSRPQEAVEQLEKFVQLEPNSSEGWWRLAKAQSLAQHTNEAMQAGQKAASLARLEGHTERADEIDGWLAKVSDGGASTALPSAPALPPQMLPPEILPPGPALPPGP